MIDRDEIAIIVLKELLQHKDINLHVISTSEAARANIARISYQIAHEMIKQHKLNAYV